MVHNIRMKNIIGVCLVLAWFVVFVYVTLIERTQSDMPMYNLQLFWCIREAWTTKNAMDWYFIVGNVSLFIPLGIILPLCFDRMRVWWRTVLFGFGFSLGIEIIQLVFRLGLFEFDDIFNNSFGTLLGYGLFVFYMGCFRREWQGRSVEGVLLLLVWIIAVVFLVVALCAGQPVFDRFLQVVLNKIVF